MENGYSVGDIAVLKKKHPCGSSEWEILRTGADIKLRCLGCGHGMMIERIKFNKMLRSVKKTGSEQI